MGNKYDLSRVRKIVMNELYKLSIYGKYHPERAQLAWDSKSPVSISASRHHYNVEHYNVEHYNVEHIVPQSLDKRVNCDLHLLFISHAMLNRVRNNYAFDEDRPKYKVTYIYEKSGYRYAYSYQKHGNERPYCGFDKYHQVFIPPEESKGIIARSLLYYQEQYQNERALSKMIYLPLLHRWNVMYPLGEAEYKRHQQIIEIQGKINPFIYYYT